MFSLDKNFLREQQKLINELQNKIIDKNILVGSMNSQLETKNRLFPYFKKIAQNLAYHFPDVDVGVNLILSILNQCDMGECNDLYVSDLEEKINQWESELMTIENKEKPEPSTIKESKGLTQDILSITSDLTEKDVQTTEERKASISTKSTKTEPTTNGKDVSVQKQKKETPPKKSKPEKKVIENFGGIVLVETED